MFDKRDEIGPTQPSSSEVAEAPSKDLADLSLFDSRGPDFLATEKTFPDAVAHLRRFPFQAPPLVDSSTAWFEGTFDPFTSSHLRILERTAELGFKRIILGIVPRNPFKSNVTHLDDRVAMADSLLASVNLKSAKTPGDEGIYITRTPLEFNVERLKSWFFNDRFLVLGIDNFQHYYSTNKPWTTILPENYLFKKATEFRRIYPILADRLLVVPEELPIHSTQVRTGEVPLLPAIADYADRHGLYPAARRPRPLHSSEAITERILEIVSGSYPHLKEPATPALLNFIASQSPANREVILQAATLALDRHEYAVRFTRGRDGKPLILHRFKAPPFEFSEESWAFREPDPIFRQIRNTLIQDIVGPYTEISGASEVLELHRSGKKIILVPNHLDYNDLALIPYALDQSKSESDALSLTIFVGPKMFHDPWNTFFILRGIGAIKIPQSPHIATESAVMTLPETSHRADNAFAIGRERLCAGDVLAIFPEGARQSNGMRAFGKGYLQAFAPQQLLSAGILPEDVFLVPTAIINADHSFSEHRLESAARAPVSITFGRPLSMAHLVSVTDGKISSVTGHLVGLAVADLLPEDKRGVYGEAGSTYVDIPDFRMSITPKEMNAILDARSLLPQIFDSRSRLRSKAP